MNNLNSLNNLNLLGNQGKVGITDLDAKAYIAAVESADGQVLENATRTAIQNFIVGAKADGIWDAIKSSNILAGARTLNGALVPLKGTAPTNFNFVSGDYSRKTGLVGNGSTKYLDSNRNNNADPQNNNHNAVYLTSAGSATSAYMGADAPTNSAGTNNFGRSSAIFLRNRTSASTQVGTTSAVGLIGTSRQLSTNFNLRVSGSTTTESIASSTPFNGNLSIFASGANGFPTSARIAFYSIGESLDLAKLDTRVTQLMTDLGTAIP